MIVSFKWTAPDGEIVSAYSWIYQSFFASWLSPINASLAFAVTYTLLWMIPLGLLYRKRIFIKV